MLPAAIAVYCFLSAVPFVWYSYTEFIEKQYFFLYIDSVPCYNKKNILDGCILHCDKRKDVFDMPYEPTHVSNYRNELREISRKIEKHKAQIATLEARRKKVETLLEKAQSEKLAQFLSETGLSVNDVISRLSDSTDDSMSSITPPEA